MSILKQAETDVLVAELCLVHGMISESFYKWRSKYGGMDASLMVRMTELDEENNRLEKLYAEKSMQNDLLKEALGKVVRPSQRREMAQWLCDENGPLLPFISTIDTTA